MSYLKFPRIRMYWARHTRVDLIASKMNRDRYFLIRQNLKVVEDDLVTDTDRKKDKFWKIRPVINSVRRGCLTNPRSRTIACDEQMIPFWGHTTMRQYVRGKPNPCGLKNFVATSPDGLPLDFFLYEGKGDTITVNGSEDNLDIGEKVIVRLSENLPEGSHIFADRYFMSVPLLDVLHTKGLQGTGTIRKSNIPKAAQFSSDATLRKTGRGSVDQLIRNDGQIALVKWFDNKPIIIASSVLSKEPTDICKRWCKKDKCFKDVSRPNIVKEYNTNMGGVDLLDRIISFYKISAKTRKWTIRTIFHFVDFSLAAGWIEYRRAARYLHTDNKNTLDYLEFRERVAETLIHSKDDQIDSVLNNEVSETDSDIEFMSPLKKKRRNPCPEPSPELRKMAASHLPEIPQQRNTSRCRYPGCNSTKARTRCTACNMFLCLTKERNCFMKYHQLKR